MNLQITLIISITLFFVLISIFVLLFISLYHKRQKSYLQEKHMLETEFQNQLLQTQIEIQEQTFTNISQELHDNIGQSITLAKLNLNTLPAIENDIINLQLQNTKDILSTTLTNIRDLAKTMLGEKIAEIGIEAAMRNELRLLEQTGKYKINIESIGEYFELPPQKAIVGFRILQEAIHNIIKHADAENINLQFTYNANKLIITLQDNGKGFNSDELKSTNTGVGLKNMNNRAALINANFKLQSSPFHGTLLTLELIS